MHEPEGNAGALHRASIHCMPIGKVTARAPDGIELGRMLCKLPIAVAV